jgi:hypothetical protein
MAPLWQETIEGVSIKLPTREGNINPERAYDNLITAGGLVLSRVGAVGLVPAVLVPLASKVVEYGAAWLTEVQDFPERSTETDSSASVLSVQFQSMLEQLVAGIEAVGGEPNVETRPAYSFDPPWMLRYQAF